MTSWTSESGLHGDERQKPGGAFSRLLPSVIAYSFVLIGLILFFHLPTATDYVGVDNDDVVRLVEVRDLLGGQSWFDLHQYRLGMDGGTLMHWSRFVDLPIAALISFFSLFTSSPVEAEALALMVWPLSTAVVFVASAGLAGRRLGGVSTMHIALGLSCLFVFTMKRFYPGSIDHHNVQIATLMLMTAMLVDKRLRASSHAIAGIAAAFAIAIGVETVPLVAVACIAVTLQWCWHGQEFARAAQSFGLALAVSISVFFFATVPPSAYGVVTCDNLSLGFYSLAAIGGAGLFLAARLPALPHLRHRLFAVAALGGIVLATAVLIAPQCLGNPLANLDPMLVDLWLNNTTEAQSALALLHASPDTFGAFYLTGMFAVLVCIFRVLQRDRVEMHLLLLALVGSAWAISIVQVRGAAISNALAIVPLAPLISDLKRHSNAEPENMNAGLAYILAVLFSVPVMWAMFGAISTNGVAQAFSYQTLVGNAGNGASEEPGCRSPSDALALADFPAGVVAAPVDSGAAILRFTPHRVLSAPYHRNQAGMLTELHIGLAKPQEAEAFLRGAKVSILAFCANDTQTQNLINMSPQGLYAELSKGKIPAFLQPQPRKDGSRFQVFTFSP